MCKKDVNDAMNEIAQLNSEINSLIKQFPTERKRDQKVAVLLSLTTPGSSQGQTTTM
jgi:hypothetical protein